MSFEGVLFMNLTEVLVAQGAPILGLDGSQCSRAHLCYFMHWADHKILFPIKREIYEGSLLLVLIYSLGICIPFVSCCGVGC